VTLSRFDFACNLDKDERKHYRKWVETCHRGTKQNVLSLPCHLNPIALVIIYQYMGVS